MTDGAIVPEWTLGDRMRKAREASGLKQEQLAMRLEVGRSTVSNWENGTNRPSAATLEMWAARCHVALDWLRGDGGGPGLPEEGSRCTSRSLVAA